MSSIFKQWCVEFHRYIYIKYNMYVAGVLLDRITRAARVRGRLPADAVGDDPAGGRRAPAHREHVHIAPLHPTLLLATRAQA